MVTWKGENKELYEKEGGGRRRKGNLGKKKRRESCEFSKVGAYDRVQYKQCWRKLE